MYNKHGHKNRYIVKALGHEGTKAIRRFSSLAAWKRFRKSRSLEVWKSGGLKRQLSWDFACADFINPPSCQASKLPNFRKRCAFAFTMAEILISLTIIGVIAAITLPSLRANINESAWATQRKALYSRMSQAISMMPSLNGYGIGANNTETASKATQTFISEGLSKVLKINNVCDKDNLKKCGFPDKIRKFGKGAPKINTPKKLTDLSFYFNVPNNQQNNQQFIYTQVVTNNAAFETVNGESVLVSYNPNCSYSYGVNSVNGMQRVMQPTMCANFIYDLNGLRGPNQVGKDIGFFTAFYPTDNEIVMPTPSGTLYLSESNYPVFSVSAGNRACRSTYGEDTKMANLEELKSLFINNSLGYKNSTHPNFLVGNTYQSSTVSQSNEVYYLDYSGEIGARQFSSALRNIFCIKR